MFGLETMSSSASLRSGELGGGDGIGTVVSVALVAPLAMIPAFALSSTDVAPPMHRRQPEEAQRRAGRLEQAAKLSFLCETWGP